MPGNATVAWSPEPSFMGDLSADPTYYQPGKNITVSELSLSRELQRIYDPDSPTPIGSIAQQVSGAIGIEFDVVGNNWHQLVFNNSDNTGWTHGRMPSSRWFFGIDALPGPTERVPFGAIVTNAELTWTEQSNLRMSLSIIYGDERKNTEITPTNPQQADVDDVFAYHGASLDLAGVAQTKLNSFTLQMSPNARFHTGASIHPLDAVIGDVNPSLTMDATFEEDDNLSAAYGGSTATSIQDRVDSITGTVTFENDVGTTLSYNLPRIDPGRDYSWNDVVSRGASASESIEYDVADVEVA